MRPEISAVVNENNPLYYGQYVSTISRTFQEMFNTFPLVYRYSKLRQPISCQEASCSLKYIKGYVNFPNVYKETEYRCHFEFPVLTYNGSK